LHRSLFRKLSNRFFLVLTRTSNELQKRAKEESESTAHVKVEVERYRQDIVRLTDALSDELSRYEAGLNQEDLSNQIGNLEIAKRGLEKTLSGLVAENEALQEELDLLNQDKNELEGQVEDLAAELERAKKDAVSNRLIYKTKLFTG
jgi:chromosome segregation ATPase